MQYLLIICFYIASPHGASVFLISQDTPFPLYLDGKLKKKILMKSVTISFKYEFPSTATYVCHHPGYLSNSGRSLKLSCETSALVTTSIDNSVTQGLIKIKERR